MLAVRIAEVAAAASVVVLEGGEREVVVDTFGGDRLNIHWLHS